MYTNTKHILITRNLIKTLITMNMLQPHRRSGRRRTAPKRFEDEKFVSGAVDRYQHCYDNHYTGNISGNENYYTTRDGNKFVSAKWGVNANGRITYRLTQRDFPESLLEFNSIWRSKNRVIPSDVLSTIASFLNIKEVDKQLIKDDDEFIAAEDSEDECEEQEDEDKESEEEWDSEEETDDDEEWEEDKSDDEDDDIPTHDGWNHRWGCPPLDASDKKKYKDSKK